MIGPTSLKLDQGERILWQGQPAQGLRLQAGDAFAIPFSLLWLGLVLLMLIGIITESLGKVDPMFFIVLPVFLAFGLYMVAGRFLVDIHTRARTHYTLTNRRAVIETGLFRKVRRVVNLASVPEITYRAGRRATGSIMFGSPSPFYGMLPASWPGSSRMLPPSFDIIDDAETIYELALSAQRER